MYTMESILPYAGCCQVFVWTQNSAGKEMKFNLTPEAKCDLKGNVTKQQLIMATMDRYHHYPTPSLNGTATSPNPHSISFGL